MCGVMKDMRLEVWWCSRCLWELHGTCLMFTCPARVLLHSRQMWQLIYYGRRCILTQFRVVFSWYYLDFLLVYWLTFKVSRPAIARHSEVFVALSGTNMGFPRLWLAKEKRISFLCKVKARGLVSFDQCQGNVSKSMFVRGTQKGRVIAFNFNKERKFSVLVNEEAMHMNSHSWTFLLFRSVPTGGTYTFQSNPIFINVVSTFRYKASLQVRHDIKNSK